MTFEEYQKLTRKTRNHELTYREQFINGALGLNGEAGEVADLIKKTYFQGHEFGDDKIAHELGDVMWYVALIADCLGMTLEDIADLNIQKLKKRYPNGFLPKDSIERKEK